MELVVKAVLCMKTDDKKSVEKINVSNRKRRQNYVMV
jgi:hypothetical protein